MLFLSISFAPHIVLAMALSLSVHLRIETSYKNMFFKHTSNKICFQTFVKGSFQTSALGS